MLMPMLMMTIQRDSSVLESGDVKQGVAAQLAPSQEVGTTLTLDMIMDLLRLYP